MNARARDEAPPFFDISIMTTLLSMTMFSVHAFCREDQLSMPEAMDVRGNREAVEMLCIVTEIYFSKFLPYIEGGA